ncbi:hypothetical protein CLAIMM_14380 [Cladophialophora immunda]|nr:hypothetical protein CLAIMM_14380 [Cladophialophora immunda]
MIRPCQLVVIELSEKGVDLGIESGYAYTHAIPVITIARQGSGISNTLRGISQAVHLYEEAVHLREFFQYLEITEVPDIKTALATMPHLTQPLLRAGGGTPLCKATYLFVSARAGGLRPIGFNDRL